MFSIFLENVPGLAWMIDEDGVILKCNNGFSISLERSPEEIQGKTVRALLGDKLGSLCEENRRKINATGEPQRFVQNLGTAQYLIHEFALPGGKEGKKRYGGIGIDVTTHLKIEEELRDSQTRLTRLNRLYSVLSQINETIVRTETRQELLDEVCRIIVDKGGIALAWICRFSRKRNEIERIAAHGPYRDYIETVDISKLEDTRTSGPAARALRTGVYALANNIPADATFKNKANASQYGLLSCAAYPFDFENGDRGCLIVYATLPHFFENEENRLFQSLADDLSFAMQSTASKERVRAAQAQLSDSQRRLSTLFGNLPGMAYRCKNDEHWTMDFVSEGVLELTGYEPEELINNQTASYAELIHPDDREWVKNDVNLAVARKNRFELTYRIQHKTKGERWVWERGLGIYDPDGKLEFLEGFISDVTDQQLTYSRLQNQAELIAQARDAIIVCDHLGQIVFWNQGASALYGFNAGKAVGQPVHQLLKTKDDRLNEARREVWQKGEWIGELERLCADGSTRTVESRWSLIEGDDPENSAVLSIDTDITERKELEKQFLRAQRMESVGSLAGGIAHDLNNILSPITMSTELLEDAMTNERERKLLKRIEDGARRAADLVQQLLSFSRGLDSSRKSVKMNDLIEDLKGLIEDTVTDDIDLQIEVEPELPDVRANPVQIQQVVLNLCVNARDAIEGAGTLAIRVFQETREHTPHEVPPGNFVVIEVQDSGIGIPDNMREQIFEPFVSTKEESRGTGLGLSTTLSIVRNHGGFIELESELNKGSCFSVFFPALGIKINDASEKRARKAIESATIMLVDDEASMRSVLSQTLESCNFNTVTAANGREALDFLSRKNEEIDLVITDINMPLVNGFRLADEIRSNYPGLPVIGMSGFQSAMLSDEEVDPQKRFDAFLSKPFSTQSLLETIEGILRESH